MKKNWEPEGNPNHHGMNMQDSLQTVFQTQDWTMVTVGSGAPPCHLKDIVIGTSSGLPDSCLVAPLSI